MKAYKGFNQDLICNNYQYEINKTYEHNGEIKCCNSGFHACESPFDVLHYYSAAENSRYFEVECDGDISHDNEDSKFACRQITLKTEIGLPGLISAGMEAVFEKVKNIKPDKATSGYKSTSATSGDYSTSATSGDYSVAVANGYEAKAKGAKGNYIVVTEYNDNYELINCKCKKVDGKTIKSDTYYMLKNGKFIEADNE